MTLHITNGDSAANLIRQSGLPGEVLPWRDVLHDGPVPEWIDLPSLSRIRAQFIHDRGWGELAAILKDFQKRDQRLRRSLQDDAVVLWFEHDLYDQLQLLQLLDWFDGCDPKHSALHMVQTDDYLGQMSPERIASLWPACQRLSDAQLTLGAEAWLAFRSTTPEAWVALLTRDTTILPHLNAAVIRQLEEYPGVHDGLSRSERTVLSLVAQGIERPWSLFEAFQDCEPARFMGDASFWWILSDLMSSGAPAIRKRDGSGFVSPYPVRPNSGPSDSGQTVRSETFKNQQFVITDNGREILNGERDILSWRRLDRWIGGVHLTSERFWRWDAQNRVLTEAC